MKKITFKYSPSDYKQFLKHSHSLKIRFILVSFLLLSWLVGFMFMAGTFDSTGLWFLIVIAGGGVGWKLYQQWTIRMLRKKGIFSQTTVTLTKTKLIAYHENAKSHFQNYRGHEFLWRDFEKLINGKHHLILFFKGKRLIFRVQRRGIVIPKSVFANQEEQTDFLQKLKQCSLHITSET